MLFAYIFDTTNFEVTNFWYTELFFWFLEKEKKSFIVGAYCLPCIRKRQHFKYLDPVVKAHRWLIYSTLNPLFTTLVIEFLMFVYVVKESLCFLVEKLQIDTKHIISTKIQRNTNISCGTMIFDQNKIETNFSSKFIRNR